MTDDKPWLDKAAVVCARGAIHRNGTTWCPAINGHHDLNEPAPYRGDPAGSYETK